MLELRSFADTDTRVLTDLKNPHAVSFLFATRAGGYSEGQYKSLNLSFGVGDDPVAVKKNRDCVLLCLSALAQDQFSRAQAEAEREHVGASVPLASFSPKTLIEFKQVHGAKVLSLTSLDDSALEKLRSEAEQGADACICTVSDVVLQILTADCAAVLLTSPRGFGVAHSGWRGSYEEISYTMARKLAEATGDDPAEMRAYIGPHISESDFEVSEDLAERFIKKFGASVLTQPRHISLRSVITKSLCSAGVLSVHISCAQYSTYSEPELFYSYRRESVRECVRDQVDISAAKPLRKISNCGRNGLLACRFSALASESQKQRLQSSTLSVKTSDRADRKLKY